MFLFEIIFCDAKYVNLLTRFIKKKSGKFNKIKQFLSRALQFFVSYSYTHALIYQIK